MPRSTKKSHHYEFRKGKVLERGGFATYVISKPLGFGDWGEVYKAEVTNLHTDEYGIPIDGIPEEIKVGQNIVIKTAVLGASKASSEDSTRSLEAVEKLWEEYSSHDRLRGVPCAARVLDIGIYEIPSSKRPTLSSFAVQRYVPGFSLQDYMEEERKDFGTCGRFKGIPMAAEFLRWSRMIACALLQVHRRQVIHGDIWPGNIMVDTSKKRAPRPVLIDFGLAQLRDLTSGRVGGETQANSEYRAPEGGGTVAADIYALGGVLYYLASGKKPPEELRGRVDIDDIKTQVSRHINAKLLRQNCGIADVIARCLRLDPLERNPHTESVLQDIETFMSDVRDTKLAQRPCKACPPPPPPSAGADVKGLSKGLTRLRRKNLLFYRMARLRAQHLLLDVDDMLSGVYDLVGDHEEIVSAMTEYLSVLRKGDRYLTLSAPSFWRAKNLGINGRFLSMNRLVAERGACVQRVFLVTPRERMRKEIRNIMSAHLRVMCAVKERTGRDPSSQEGAPGYYAAFMEVKEVERDDLLRQGFHFGLLQKKKQFVLLVPVYRNDGVITAIQFRAAVDIQDKLRKFSELLRKAHPMWEFREARSSRKRIRSGS